MRTVTGAFDDREEAHRAVSKVIGAGLPRDDVHLQPLPGSYAAVVASAGASPPAGAFRRRVERVLCLLLGDPDPGEPGTARDAFRHGRAVVVVHVENDTQAGRVSAWMLEYGAFDVEDRTSAWRTA